MSKLTIDLKVGQSLTIGTASVTLMRKSGQLARLEILADADTEIRTPNRQASATPARKSVPEQTGD